MTEEGEEEIIKVKKKFIGSTKEDLLKPSRNPTTVLDSIKDCYKSRKGI